MLTSANVVSGSRSHIVCLKCTFTFVIQIFGHAHVSVIPVHSLSPRVRGHHGNLRVPTMVTASKQACCEMTDALTTHGKVSAAVSPQAEALVAEFFL